MASQRNVVFIGLGLGGVATASALRDSLPPTHRLIVITATEVGYSTVASVRAAVVPGWEKKNVIPLDKFLPKGSRHLLLTGTKVIQLKENEVIIDKAHSSFGSTIPFEYAVIATGSKYDVPWRPAEAASLEEVQNRLQSLQQDVAAASSILVVGGGPVGIEVAGEVKSQHPTKAVTLVTGAKSLLNATIPEKTRKSLLDQAQRLGIDVVLGQRVELNGAKSGKIEQRTFELANGKRINADFLFVADGGSPNSELVQNFAPQAIAANGRVKVKPTLQIDSHDHIFAAGDVADTDEIKTSVTAAGHKLIATNILALIAGKTTLKQHKPAGPLMIVTLGPQAGAGTMFGWNVGAWVARTIKGKTLFIPQFVPLFASK